MTSMTLNPLQKNLALYQVITLQYVTLTQLGDLQANPSEIFQDVQKPKSW